MQLIASIFRSKIPYFTAILIVVMGINYVNGDYIFDNLMLAIFAAGAFTWKPSIFMRVPKRNEYSFLKSLPFYFAVTCILVFSFAFCSYKNPNFSYKASILTAFLTSLIPPIVDASQYVD